MLASRRMFPVARNAMAALEWLLAAEREGRLQQ
jgi:hypothetical protein